MLRIAVQAKGRLFEETMALLEESDIKLSTTKRTLLVQSSNFPVEVLFLRDDDIPQSVATGVADLGIVGENEFVERQEDAEIIKRLGFSKCRLSLAMPKDIEYHGCSRHRIGGCYFRYCQFRFYSSQQSPERSGGRNEIRSFADRQQEYE